MGAAAKVTLVDVAALDPATALGVGAWTFNPTDDSNVKRQRSTTTTEEDPAAEGTATASLHHRRPADPNAATTIAPAAPEAGVPVPATRERSGHDRARRRRHDDHLGAGRPGHHRIVLTPSAISSPATGLWANPHGATPALAGPATNRSATGRRP